MLFTRNFITFFIPEFSSVSDNSFTVAVNSLGMEVESIRKFDIPNNCVIGQIQSITDIEGTHLHYCDVLVGPNQVNKIVCGASGLVVGKKVIVALEGAKLPNGITIAKRLIRGYESNGMMCAYSELTNNKDIVADAEKDEIVMFDKGEVGASNWPEIIGLDDTIYDITVPANRNDENSYFVFCFELAGKLGIKFNYNLKVLLKQLPGECEEVRVNDKVCSFLNFIDFRVTPKMLSRSSWDTKSVLMNHGIKPINYLLDKLAIISLLTNCPTHVYDADKLVGEMRCDVAVGSEKFIGLNSNSYTLEKNDIVIYDQNQPVSLAAVMGSDYTKLTDKTQTVRIEVGNFGFANVRQTALRLNLETDAAKKASKPLSNYLTLSTAELVKRNFGRPIAEKLTFKPNWFNKPITLNWDTLRWFINEPLDRSFVIEALKKQGYEHGFINKNNFKPAPWRLDISNQEDMFEDILKILDINKLQSISISDKLLPIADNTEYELKQEVKDILINNCINEVKTYNLTNKNNLEKFNFFNKTNPIKIQCNNSNREYFRLSMIDNMLKAYQYNAARKLDLIPIFEIQKLFTNDTKNQNLSILSTNEYVFDEITGSKIQVNLGTFKEILNNIVKEVFNNEVVYKLEPNPYCYLNEALTIYYKDKPIGYAGKIKQSLLKDYDLSNKAIYCLTINIEQLFADYKPMKFKVKPFGIYQRLSKDINIELNVNNLTLINNKVEKIASVKDVASAEVISIFRKEDKVVYTVRYYLVDTKKFTTSDIDEIHNQIQKVIA